MNEGKLYIIPTPIGNLDDITLRALKVLNSMDVVLAEDKRKSSILFKHFEIKTKLDSFHKFNEHKKVESVIEAIKSGLNYGLISDAGTPGISDPGFLLVRECLKGEIAVECLPGATAFVPALINSGFPSDKFVFEGFLPHKKGRQTRLKLLSEESRTVILYESPNRLLKLLEQIKEFMGTERKIAVSRELTKLYEENISGNAEELIQHFSKKNIKGEIVVVIEGKG